MTGPRPWPCTRSYLHGVFFSTLRYMMQISLNTRPFLFAISLSPIIPWNRALQFTASVPLTLLLYSSLLLSKNGTESQYWGAQVSVNTKEFTLLFCFTWNNILDTVASFKIMRSKRKGEPWLNDTHTDQTGMKGGGSWMQANQEISGTW